MDAPRSKYSKDAKGMCGSTGAKTVWLGIPELLCAASALQRYRPVDLLHEGGRSYILAVTDPEGNDLALKIIRDSVSNPMRKARNEFSRLRAVDSAHVVRAHELIQKHAILVVERLTPLHDPSPVEAIRMAADCCRGLAALHALKDPLYHLDVKIENICKRDDEWVLVDLGGAKSYSTLQRASTLEPLAPGKPLPHRPPEVNNRVPSQVGSWSDLYGIGYLLKRFTFGLSHPQLGRLTEALTDPQPHRRPKHAKEIAITLDSFI